MARATVLPVIRRRWHDKSKLHVVGQLIVSSGNYETEMGIGDLLLVSNEYRNVTAIASDTSLTVGAAFSDNANDRAPKRLDVLTNITGQIDVNAATIVPGVGTLFTKEIEVGDLLVIGTATAGEARVVVSVQSDTQLTVATAFTNLANDTSPQICKKNGTRGREDWTVITGEIDPAASTTVTGVNTQFLGSGILFDLTTPDVFSRSVPLWMDIDSERGGLDYILRRKETLKDLTGTVDTAASVTVPGVGTLFLTELVVGDEVLFGIERRYVTAIASNTSLTVNRAHTDQANDLTPQKVVRETGAIFELRLQIKDSTHANIATGAVPNSVLDDKINFHAVFDLG